MGAVGAEALPGPLDTGPASVPDLPLPVPGPDEQHVLLVGGGRVDEHDRVRLVEPGEVVEVRVLAERVLNIVVAGHLSGRRDQGHSVADQPCEPLSAVRVQDLVGWDLP